MAEKKYSQMLQEIDALTDERFGKVGTPEREAFRKEAYAYCVGQIISEARKRGKVRLAYALWFRNL
jgi:hypothetical protein